MPTVSLNECGVVVRGWVSSTPSILTSLDSEPRLWRGDGPWDPYCRWDMCASLLFLGDDEKGAELGVKLENTELGFSVAGLYRFRGEPSSSGAGFCFFFPDEDSVFGSGGCVPCGVAAPVGATSEALGGVRAYDSGPPGEACVDGSLDVMEGLDLRGGGYGSPFACASCLLISVTAFGGRPRFFLFAGSPADGTVAP